MKVKEGIHDRDILSRPLSNPHSKDKPTSPEELAKQADNRSEMQLRVRYRKEINDPKISDDELRYILGHEMELHSDHKNSTLSSLTIHIKF
mgnify:CR=1 FL=1